MQSELQPGWRRPIAAACGAAWCGSALAAQTPDAAAARINDPAAGWDRLWNTVILDITVIGVLFALVMAWFLYRYRAREPGRTGTARGLSTAAAIGWALIPTFVFLADDLYIAANGWKLWNDYRDVPAERIEVKLETGMYSYDYTYANGVRTQNELRVPAGKAVLLRMTSRDTLHSHFIPDFRVKEDSMPGRVTYLWFYPKAPGEHVVTCAEYCGVGHAYMAGKIIVLPAHEFDAWLDREATRIGQQAHPAAAGAES